VNVTSPSTAANNLVSQGSFLWATTKTSSEINLGPLANNGGPTQTLALLNGSVAIATGNATISNAVPLSGLDQRGYTRSATAPSIGAFEYIPTNNITVINNSDSGAGSLRQAIIDANATVVNEIIDFNFASGTSPHTITLAAALPTILNASTAGNLAIIGLSASSITIDANKGNFSIFTIDTGANLTISRVTVTGANNSGNGGGFNNSGSLTVSNSTISGNSALGTNKGGGIWNKGTLSVSNSTISENSASYGGGMYSYPYYCGCYGSSSPFSNNAPDTVTVTNSTFSGNSATTGGGIFNFGTLNIANTIIANSTNGGDYAGTGTIGTNTNNLVEDGSLSGAIAADPLLGPLQNNGGPTFTMALGVGSPAIAAGDATISNAPPVNGLDQRGYTRSATFLPSIGALEYNATGPAPTVTSISPTSGSTAGGTTITITGTGFTQVISVNIGDVAAKNVRVVSSTSITATTPPHASGSASVLVTTADGTSTSNTSFTYAAATAPLVVGTPPPTSSGSSSTVTLHDPVTGAEAGTAVPFPGFNGPIKVVSGDFNGDGIAELIAGAGFGGGPAIAILNSQTGEVMEAFFAFDPSFTGGVFIAVQDANGDGILDIIAAAGPGGGPEVRIFDGSNLNVLRSFFAYDQAFSGGVSVASIDFNNDGILDIVTGAGPGGAPHVKVFDGATDAIISQWYAYADFHDDEEENIPFSSGSSSIIFIDLENEPNPDTDFTGGVFVAVGDIGNNGTFEVVTGAGPGRAPIVAVWNPFTGGLLSKFMAYAEDFTGGVSVAVNDGNGDGIADIITGAGPGGGPQVNVYNFRALDLLLSFYSGDPANTGGVFVG